MKQVLLPYGTETVAFEIPDDAEMFQVSDPKPEITPAVFRQRLSAFLASKHLSTSAVAVVVGDKTRLCGYAQFLPVLVNTLTDFGATRPDISVYIAYGTHPHQPDPVSESAYGETFQRYRFVHHDCHDEALFAHLGNTTRGTPVMIRKDIMDADFLITFGAISHHYFAGFGGGRKLVFPGLGHREAIFHNHGLFLDRNTRTLADGCRPGRLDRNPLAEDLAEIEAHRSADMAVHGILDSGGRVCDLQVGSGSTHFRNACTMHAGHCEVKAIQRFDRVLASCGGHPKDINFIQSHKALHHAADFVRDGGELVLLAACPDGIGSQTFLPWFQMGGHQAAFDALAASYAGNGGTALAMLTKTERIRIAMVTALDDADTRLIGVESISPAQAAKRLRRGAGRLAVIPNASLTVRKDD